MKARRAIGLALVSFVLLLAAVGAHAQLFRAYLSIDGNDANPCTLQQPCRLLPAALNVVAAGGQVWMLDSANYNTAPVAVSKSVTILAVPGAVGSVVATGGPAISVATAGVEVALRNLVIGPLPGAAGTNGIEMTDGSELTVEGCLVANLPANGIFVDGSRAVSIVDTTIRDNGGRGIYLTNGVRGTLHRVVVSGNGSHGMEVDATVASTTHVHVAESTASRNVNHGFFARSSVAGGVVRVSVRHSSAVHNFHGMIAQVGNGGDSRIAIANSTSAHNTSVGMGASFPGALAWLSGNTVTDNQIGIRLFSGGVVESAGNNAVRNNVNNTDGGLVTAVAPM